MPIQQLPLMKGVGKDFRNARLYRLSASEYAGNFDIIST